jgi:hypothetical protein
MRFYFCVRRRRGGALKILLKRSEPLLKLGPLPSLRGFFHLTLQMFNALIVGVNLTT